MDVEVSDFSEFEVETHYNRCRALMNAAGHVSSEDKEALMWILEEEFGKLGEAIEKVRKK